MDFHRQGAKNAKVPQRGSGPCGRGRDYIRSVLEKPRPIFARRIFWDEDFDKLDYDGKASFVIERVFERGDVEDIRQCRRYYGDEKVVDALLKAKFLPLATLHFVSAIFDKPIETFRCFTLRQSSQGRLPY